MKRLYLQWQAVALACMVPYLCTQLCTPPAPSKGTLFCLGKILSIHETCSGELAVIVCPLAVAQGLVYRGIKNTNTNNLTFMRGGREGRGEDKRDMERAQGFQCFQMSSVNYRNINLI